MHPNNCVRFGSAVIIKKEIAHHCDFKMEKEEFQVTSVKFQTTSGVIRLSVIYSPPRHNLEREDYLNLLQSFSGKFILGGDFNSKNTHWGSRIIRVSVIYSPPRHNLEREDYLNLLQSFSGKFILGGDFNSKNTHWGSRLTNTKGSELYTMLSKGITVKYTRQENQHISRKM